MVLPHLSASWCWCQTNNCHFVYQWFDSYNNNMLAFLLWKAKLRSSSWWIRYFLQTSLEENEVAIKKFEQAATKRSYVPNCQIFHLKSLHWYLTYFHLRSFDWYLDILLSVILKLHGAAKLKLSSILSVTISLKKMFIMISLHYSVC